MGGRGRRRRAETGRARGFRGAGWGLSPLGRSSPKLGLVRENAAISGRYSQFSGDPERSVSGFPRNFAAHICGNMGNKPFCCSHVSNKQRCLSYFWKYDRQMILSITLRDKRCCLSYFGKYEGQMILSITLRDKRRCLSYFGKYEGQMILSIIHDRQTVLPIILAEI